MRVMIKIAWRNIWRNTRRSLIMIFAITTGLWAGLFVSALMFGMMETRFETAIEQHVSHIQMHHPGFLADKNLTHSIPGWVKMRDQLGAESQVRAFTGRAITSGMIATATQTRGVTIVGIDPAAEANTTGLDKSILEGSYLEEGMGNQAMIGRSLAEKLKLRVGSRIVITFQNAAGELISTAFRVAGIYQTANITLDEQNIFILGSALAQYNGNEMQVNEIAILLHHHELADSKRETLKAIYPKLTVRTWGEISPELSYIQGMGQSMMLVILVIILLALAFGLVNTMLMSVHERVYELGMLMAVGMNRKKVFLVIILETTFLTILGAFAGMTLGYLTAHFLGRAGLDLAPIGGEAMVQFGYPSVVYPAMETSFLVQLSFLVVMMVFVTAIFPTIRALKLKPAVAVRND